MVTLAVGTDRVCARNSGSAAYLCFLAGADFFAGWDFFTGSDFLCGSAGAFSRVFFARTLFLAAGLRRGRLYRRPPNRFGRSRLARRLAWLRPLWQEPL